MTRGYNPQLARLAKLKVRHLVALYMAAFPERPLPTQRNGQLSRDGLMTALLKAGSR